ncbi:protein-glutamate methylesterase/protein-glutamine glutaminase [Granulicella aggregans]|jgi:two-component system chemotaxis response regulator CheB|uniref:protein-glutamate methylesterase/protein-glutamine glutaminase n=1 Tax=Granulicella aggregans TaxID=474949 RepID=UPI0021E04F8C|nr:chemotaxis response regulator protein-glutamate methylesterase [Granulicella aggregans]
MSAPNGKIKVMVVDDSAIVRKILSDTIAMESDMEVVATAPDPYVARDKILALKPDVITLDIEMPRMDGLTFLKKLMKFHPLPVIIISSLTKASCEISLEALASGAVEVMEKPGGPYSIGELREGLAQKLRAAAGARVSAPASKQFVVPPPPPQAPSLMQNDMVIAIGASTGGTEAIRDVLMQLPANIPGIVITQHIPKQFSTSFARRLDASCPFEVKEAEDGDEVRPGRALVAPGDFHMVLRARAGGYFVQVQDGPKICYQRPAVDVMFASVANTAKSRAVGVLLTGMGADGAQGLLSMRNAGARTISQNEQTCVVYGMPREAERLKAVEQVLPLPGIPAAIVKLVSKGAQAIKRSA